MDFSGILGEYREKMEKSLVNFQRELASIRTGRAHPSLLDQIKIDVYGQLSPISMVATVNVVDNNTLLVTVWDASNVKLVDSAIRTSSLGLNPKVEGNKLYITFPQLTFERRQDMIKVTKKKSEEMKISVRNIRRDANDNSKKLEKNGEISEDELKSHLEKSQELTDNYIKQIDEILKNKQSELEKI